MFPETILLEDHTEIFKGNTEMHGMEVFKDLQELNILETSYY